MRIGFEAKRIYHNRSGLGNYGRNLIRALAQYYPQQEYLLYNFKKASVSFETPPAAQEILPPSNNPIYRQLWRRRFLSSRAKKDRLDLFHGLSQELPSGLAKKGIPAIVTVHDLIFLRFPELYRPLDRKVYLKKLKAACQNADRVVAISRQTRQDLIEFLGVPAEKILVIYQNCSPTFGQDHSARFNHLQKQEQLPDKFVLFVGTLEERKNPVRLAQACLAEGFPLVLVGKATPYWQKFYQNLSTAQKKGLYPLSIADNHDLAALYQGATLFAYPSVFEGFGIPVLEALQSGTPVITGNNSALREFAPAVRLIDVNDPQAYQDALRHLMGQTAERERLSKVGCNFAQQFSAENISRQWMAVYREILRP